MSTINSRCKVTAPDTVNVTMTISMTLEDWKKLRAQLSGDEPWQHWPGSQFREDVQDMVRQLETTYFPGPPNIPLPTVTL